MGRILSRGCRKGPIHFLVRQFLCSTWQPVSSFSNRDAKGKHKVIDQGAISSPSKPISLVRPAPRGFPSPRPQRCSRRRAQERSRMARSATRRASSLTAPSTTAHCFDRGPLFPSYRRNVRPTGRDRHGSLQVRGVPARRPRPTGSIGRRAQERSKDGASAPPARARP